MVGEAEKIVVASHRRFAAITPTPTGFDATIHVASEETMLLWVLPPGPNPSSGAESSPALDVLVIVCHAGKCGGEDCDVEMALACSGQRCTCQ